MPARRHLSGRGGPPPGTVVLSVPRILLIRLGLRDALLWRLAGSRTERPRPRERVVDEGVLDLVFVRQEAPLHVQRQVADLRAQKRRLYPFGGIPLLYCPLGLRVPLLYGPARKAELVRRFQQLQARLTKRHGANADVHGSRVRLPGAPSTSHAVGIEGDVACFDLQALAFGQRHLRPDGGSAPPAAAVVDHDGLAGRHPGLLPARRRPQVPGSLARLEHPLFFRGR